MASSAQDAAGVHASFTNDKVQKGETYYNFGVNRFSSEEAPGVSVFLGLDERLEAAGVSRVGVEDRAGGVFILSVGKQPAGCKSYKLPATVNVCLFW